MTMGPGGEIKIPLHIDTSQVADDLLAVDREIQRLEQRIMAAFNRGKRVRKGTVPRAESIEDVGRYNNDWTPEVRSLQRQLGARIQQIERVAQRGETKPPLTPGAQARQEAQQRLQAASRPIEITAKQKFFDDMRTSLLRGLGSAPSMAAAQTGIPGASGLARTLMGLVADNPALAAGLGGAAALGGGALAINAMQSSFQRQQAALAGALVGGPAFGQTRTLLGLGVMAAAQSQDVSQEGGAALAQQMAGAGMTPQQVLRNMPNVFGLTQRYGQQIGDVEPLVAALGTAGGMNASQIKQTLSDVVDVSGKATGSIQQLTQGLGALSAVNTQAARDAYGLAAVQRAVGPTSGINAGRLLAPAMGAFGAQALGLSGLLGISTDRLAQLQRSKGGMAQIFGLEGRFMQQMPHDVVGQELGLQILQDMAGADFSKLTVDQKLNLARTWQSNPDQAYAYYQSIVHRPPPHRPLPPTNVSAPERARILAQNTLTRAVATHSLGDLSFRALQGVGTGNFAPLLDAFFPLPQAPMHFIPPDQLARRLQQEQRAHSGSGGGGKFGLHTLSPSLLGQVRAAAGDVTHTVKIDVTVKDPRGNTLGHAVDHRRVIAGSSGTLRAPYDHPRRSTPPPWTGGGTGGHGGGGGSSGFD